MDLVLHVLCVKGRATHETLQEAMEFEQELNCLAVIDRFLRDGLVESTRFGFKVTERGRSRVQELYERERRRAGPLILDVYESFLPINDDVKQIVTDWQLRPAGRELVPNDHRDPDHDAAVLARLHETDARVGPALAPLTQPLPRFTSYSRRLERALVRIREGDHSMVAAPIKDSYHTVWFELHEELLVLSGHQRTE